MGIKRKDEKEWKAASRVGLESTLREKSCKAHCFTELRRTDLGLRTYLLGLYTPAQH